MRKIKYKISVMIANGRQLTFNVLKYETLQGGFIQFYDGRTGRTKIFDGRLCEIEVLHDE